MQQFWNERFSADTYLYGIEPNPQFKEFLDENAVGSILLPGEGEGRNAVYAAKNGWEVTAIDQSEVGSKKALQLAASENVEINYLVGDITKTTLKTEQFDVIALVFLHLPPEIRSAIHHHLISLLKKGGKLFVVGFSKEQLNYDSGGPKNPKMLYTKEVLLNDFKELEVIANKESICELSEGSGHKGIASIRVFEAIKR